MPPTDAMEKPPTAERAAGPIAVFSNSYARLPEHFFARLLHGSIKVGNDKLPTPRIKQEMVPTSIGRGEFVVVLEQRVPRPLAERMGQMIDAGDTVSMGLNDLKILISSPHDKVRLPIWNSITINKRQDYVLTGRIIELSARGGFG